MNQLPTVLERASLALGSSEHEKMLQSLAEKHKAITQISNPAGYQDAQSARMELRNARVDLEKKGKAAREDAQLFSKAVIAEEKRLIEIIKPEEERIDQLQIAWDEKIAAEKKAREEAELKRVAAIRSHIDRFRSVSGSLVGKPSQDISSRLDQLKAELIDPEFYAEFYQEAKDAHLIAVGQVHALLVSTVEQEAEFAKIVAERVELERLRKEQADREAAERERIAAETKRQAEEQAAARAKADAEAEARRKIEQAEIDKQRKALADEAARIAAEREKLEAAQRAESERLAAEEAVRQAAFAASITSPAELSAPVVQSLPAAKTNVVSIDKELRDEYTSEITSALDQLTTQQLCQVVGVCRQLLREAA